MANKLLLLQDVEALGKKGDVVNVRPGYARNFLLPEGFAVIADKQTLKIQARLQEERKQQAANDRKEAEALAEKMQGATLVAVVKVDHEGRMYGSVTANEIIHLLEEQLSLQIEKRFIQLKQPIKTIGTHTIPFRFKEGVNASVDLNVEAEGQQKASAKE